jgi:hypothetical protein
LQPLFVIVITYKGDEIINAPKYTEDLEEAGFTPKQAKVSVNAWLDLMNSNFATKSDLKDLEYVTKSSLKDFEISFVKRCDELEGKFDKRCDAIESKFIQFENKIVTKLGGLMIVLFGVATTVIKL